ncbi:MAG: isoprenyl transferase [Clostridia bacterium]|nr:isoprenyl transferase [Clostridia bacterium]
MSLFNREKVRLARCRVDYNNIPEHIAIIMDGNGRWAKKRALPRAAGHAAGAQLIETILEYAGNIGVKTLTAYAFSTENWNRPEDEVNALMGLFDKYLRRAFKKMMLHDVRFHLLGDIEELSPSLKSLCTQLEETTKNNKTVLFNLALNYGSRAEIAYAAACVARDAANGTIRPEDVDESAIEKYLYTAGQRDPDLIIRTSGEKRVSNFLLWQSAYSEFVFSPVLWPDFTPACLLEAISEYQKRSRRFGKV